MSVSVAPKANFHKIGKPAFLQRLLLLVGAVLFIGFALLPSLALMPTQMEGKPAPDFVLSAVANAEPGSRVQLSQLAGKPVVVAFWASWCGPCRAETPALNRLYKRLSQQGVSLIGVNTQDDPSRALAFIKSAKLDYPIVSDEDGNVASSFGVSSLPTIVVIDKQGTIVAVRKGLSDESALESLALSVR